MNDEPKTQEPVAAEEPKAEAPAEEKKSLYHQLLDALKADDRTKDLHSVHAKLTGAVVFLDGETRTEAERAAAEEVVRKIEGIHFVQNRLQINPQARPGGWREKKRK